jgi:hypothetical protein
MWGRAGGDVESSWRKCRAERAQMSGRAGGDVESSGRMPDRLPGVAGLEASAPSVRLLPQVGSAARRLLYSRMAHRYATTAMPTLHASAPMACSLLLPPVSSARTVSVTGVNG